LRSFVLLAGDRAEHQGVDEEVDGETLGSMCQSMRMHINASTAEAMCFNAKKKVTARTKKR
jgi:hypothetical protein